MILHMAGLRSSKISLFAIFALVTGIAGLPEISRGSDAGQPLTITRDKEKTVYIIDEPQKEGARDDGTNCDVLKNLIIDTRGDDGKRPDSDRRRRGEHP